MRSLFSLLNSRDISLDISTFSKASKQRNIEIFVKIFERLQADIKRQLINKSCLSLFPLDSTIVTLTSKLLWQQEYHQVKLFAGTDNERGIIDGVHIHFGQGHDSEHGDETIAATPQNGVAVMNRGFSITERVQALMKQENQYFVLRIKNNYTINMKEDGTYEVWSEKRKVQVRLVTFSD